MLYKMLAAGKFRGHVMEYTYAEQIEVRNGIALCRSIVTRDVLYLRGYDLIEEVPINLKPDEGIPIELYTEKKYQKPVTNHGKKNNHKNVHKSGDNQKINRQ